MKKIAFLFLTIGNPNFPKIWNAYFKNHRDKYNIYIHAKNPEQLTWKKSRLIKNLQETGWGFITRAYIELLKEAYKDPDNYKFITISESCVPIQSFDNFYEDVINDDRSWIKNMKISKYNYEVRINPQTTKPKPHYFLKNYARFCLNREHVALLLSKEKELEFFHNMHVGDEFFLTLLCTATKNSHCTLKNYKDFAVTYDDWEYVNKKKIEIKNQIRKLYELQESKNVNKSNNIMTLKKLHDDIAKNPKTIIDVADDLDKIKSSTSYFYRKFAPTSNIEKYWKDIINSTLHRRH